MAGQEPAVILIAGATASGKSSLAVEMARKSQAVIVNADSMQVYRDLAILTARPGATDCSTVDHLLFGHVDAARRYSVADWLGDVKPILARMIELKRQVILVGGTGLYFKALSEGLSDIPSADPSVRARWEEVARAQPDRLHKELEQRDPQGAALLAPSDRQRLVRALEVFDTTGKSISYWQGRRLQPPLAGLLTKRLFLDLPPAKLAERINLRMDEMVSAGAIEEVQTIISRRLSPDLLAMKAIGVPQFSQYLHGEISLEAAIEQAKAATRQYAKRQRTWFRHQLDTEWEKISPKA